MTAKLTMFTKQTTSIDVIVILVVFALIVMACRITARPVIVRAVPS